MDLTIIPGVPAGTPPLRMLFDIPARASHIYRANGVAIVVEGYTIYRFVNGETTTTLTYTITPRAPSALELLVAPAEAKRRAPQLHGSTWCHAPGQAHTPILCLG